VDEEYPDKTQPNLRQSMNGSCGDIPSGFRPCPFCHAVILWESERCPSCGRLLIERVGSGASQTPPSVARPSRQASWWSARVRLVLPRARHAVLPGGRRSLNRVLCAPRDSWATTSRGTSWSAFQLTRPPARLWWLGSIPAPTERERQIFVIATALMVELLVVALLVR
jgi:hypothetical protein